jgi:nitrite reductase/ring-hydroxylating ferredoxin subunit
MFRRKPPVDSEGYVDSGVVITTLAESEMTRVKLHGRVLVLTLLEGSAVAFGDTCPHGAASLAKGSLQGRQVCCADHGYCFDIVTGRLNWPPDEPYRLRLHAVKVEDGRVKVRLEPE